MRKYEIMAKNDISNLRQYLQKLVPARPTELQDMESYARENGFPIIGPVSGQVCYQVSRMLGARRVFELGSGYGYSTAWFARAVAENGGGEVHHVVWDVELSNMARRHLDVLGYSAIVRFQVGEAVAALRETAGPFDLIFNDINKEAYPDSLPVISEKLRPGGVLIIDNMIWGGRVYDPDDQAPSTVAIRRLTRLLIEDEGWITSLVPVGDGLMIAYKTV
jgi:caffeoyl-CoA O-methyltransferase